LDGYNLTQTFPSSEKFGLSSQITRTAVSISSNIAEGSSRRSEKNYYRFMKFLFGGLMS